MCEIQLDSSTISTKNTQNQRNSTNSTKNQRNQRNPQNEQNQQKSSRPRRLITGGRKSQQNQFGIHLPQASLAEKMVEREESKKRLRAQEEIQQSSTNLVKSAVGKLG